MAHADTASDLKALIQSRHPIVTIDTVEEERVDNLLQSVAADLHVPLFTWTVTHGLQRVGEGAAAIYGTANPQVLVKHLATLTVCGVFHLKDLHAHLGDATVARGLRDIAQAFLTTGSTAVLSGEGIHLPSELSRDAIPFELHLPNRERVFADLNILATEAKGLSGGDILNVCLNAIYAGSTADEMREWKVTGTETTLLSRMDSTR